MQLSVLNVKNVPVINQAVALRRRWTTGTTGRTQDESNE
mgnify:FL=1